MKNNNIVAVYLSFPINEEIQKGEFFMNSCVASRRIYFSRIINTRQYIEQHNSPSKSLSQNTRLFERYGKQCHILLRRERRNIHVR